VIDGPIARVRREHRAIQQGLHRLERILAGINGSRRPRLLLTALGEFVETCDRCIEPHLATEERAIYPHLRQCLPAENDAVSDAIREHETLRELIGLVRLRSDRLLSGAPDSHVDMAETIGDFATLWRAHAHRVDEVVGPLLKSLGAPRACPTRAQRAGEAVSE
jgi:hemerythrin-like domain-containing protein